MTILTCSLNNLQSIVMTAIAAEGVRYKLDMAFVKENSTYAFILKVDGDIELVCGTGKMPQVCRNI